jgi:ABC-2 type transport system ATP-binding protein
MSISVKHLTKIYGAQKAINDLSFSVSRGEVVGFLGPNGAGKSTTMKILTGYMPATTGEAMVCGLSVDTRPLEVKTKIGYLPESNPLYPEMYVKECLSFTAGVYEVPHRAKRIAEMIELTGLTREWKKKIGALSKGYRQRVGLAQALLHDPEVLILDEPTTGLDPNQLTEIRNLIRALGRDKTVLLSTHIMQEVQAICDRVIIINQGRIVADATLSSLQRATADTILTIEFSDPVDASWLQGIQEVKEVRQLSAHLWTLTTPSAEAVKKSLWQLTLQNNLNIVSLQSNTPMLEEVFRKLTTENKSGDNTV